MTSAPETERPESSGPPESSGASSESPEAPVADAPPARPRTLLAALTGLVAVLCALALPFAPLSVNEPTVSWPKDPSRPESTLLNLTAYRPLALDATITCAVARQAQAADPSGVVLATVEPQWPLAGDEGMVITARDNRLQVRAMGRVLVDDPLAGACTYTVSGTSTGRPKYQGATPDPLDPAVPDLTALAGPDDAVLTVFRDGTELTRATAPLLPSVDMLTTSATAVAPGALRVTLAVDDEFTSSPAPLKRLLIGLLVVMLLATAALLVRADRGVARPSPPSWFGRPRVVDVVVPVVIAFWTLVAPATDDDGYYAAMARNSRISGAVGNYYQLYDQNFTPFTWFYYVLGWWQGVVGDAPVLQRLLAVAFGLLTWLLLRRFAADAMDEIAPERPWVRSACHAILAAAFLAWWLPQDMGVRPEGVVCVCAAAAMHAVLVAWRRERLAVAWLAFALAGLGFAAHPTGFTLLAPLLAGLPLLWRLVAVPGYRAATALRVVAVASGGMVAPLLAFVDGGLRDFLRGQRIFLAIQAQESWATEIQRYDFLLTQIPMGNYAKRMAVLLCLVSLVWFAVLAAAARMRRVPLPVALWFSASTTALAFAALWFTPSKWTHHFGALAGVGSAFLALFLALAVPTVRSVLDMKRLPYGLVAAAAGSYVLAIALSWHGPNQWPYAWLDGVRRPEFPPAIKRVLLDSPLLWLLVLAVVVVALTVPTRMVGTRDPRLNVLRAVPIIAVIALVGTSVYTVFTFGLAAVQGVPRSSLWAQSLADPTASRCAAAAGTEVLDPFTAVPLTEVAGLPAPPPATGFVNNGGFYAGNRPQGVAGDRVWGSLVARDGASADSTQGRLTTSWYGLPDRSAGTVTVIAAGSLSDGVGLTAEYGRRSGDVVEPAGTESLTDAAHDPSWRTLTLEPPAGADLVRLVGVDESSTVNGWLALSAPVVARPETLAEFLPRPAPVALGWPLAFAWPCQRQPGIVNGITEPAAFGVLWGANGALSGFSDGAWQPSRGGAFAQVPRSQSVLELATVEPADPDVQVAVFGSDLGRDRYTLTEDKRTVSGASTATGPRTVG
ncbi:MAG TPA: arabinosyltransferase domain-containing protein [Pseudonocardia sp.]|nr:arabinosyltransferase domain-containing protein [Pseudonocardia sp.]